MANVKVFADKQTNRWTNGQKQYAPIYRCRGIKNIVILFKFFAKQHQFESINFVDDKSKVLVGQMMIAVFEKVENMCTHFNTLKKKALGKHRGKRWICSK